MEKYGKQKLNSFGRKYRRISLCPQGTKGFLKQFTKNRNKHGKRWIDLTPLKCKHLCASKGTVNKVKKRSHRPREEICNP